MLLRPQMKKAPDESEAFASDALGQVAPAKPVISI